MTNEKAKSARQVDSAQPAQAQPDLEEKDVDMESIRSEVWTMNVKVKAKSTSSERCDS
jgi:hypothetical protein